MRTAGIIGGLGPETTAEFYLRLIFSCQELNQVSRPPILIWSVPLAYQVEQDVLENDRNEEDCLPYLIEGAKILEKAGADFIVMPCNTLHIFIKQVRESVSIPVLSIVEETLAFLAQQKIHNIAFLATETTVRQQLYEKEFIRQGVRYTLPSVEDQKRLGSIIYRLVSKRYNLNDKHDLINLVESFSPHDVKDIVLACTDLQILMPNHPNLRVHDTMLILAEATVREILKDAAP